MNSVLDLFSVRLLATNQSLILERSWFRLHSIRSGSLPAKVKCVSPAYI